jgi:serine protease Do
MLLGVSLVVAATTAICHGDAPAGPYAKAVAYAQARTVKIYGASIGREPGYASGIVVSADGHILTAAGTFLNAQQLQVTLPDGTLHEAELVRQSRPLQTALLKIAAATPDFFDLSADTEVGKGDWVLAVSNAFKVAHGREPLSVNLGVVALRTYLATKRGTQDIPYDADVLLLDAITSNPGAPGGAVVNGKGQLAGMIGRVLEGKDTKTRLNYAVPSDLLAKFVSQSEDDPMVAASPADMGGDLGIRLFSLAGTRAAAYVDRVLPQSPAAAAGIQADDLILNVDGKPVRDVRSYQQIVATLTPGKEVFVVVKRKNNILRVPVTPVPARRSQENDIPNVRIPSLPRLP